MRLLWNDAQARSGSPLQGIARHMITCKLVGLIELPIRLEVSPRKVAALRIPAATSLGLAVQDRERALQHPGFGLFTAFGMEAKGRAPKVFEDVDEIENKGRPDAMTGNAGLDLLQLLRLAVDEHHPRPLSFGIAAQGF